MVASLKKPPKPKRVAVKTPKNIPIKDHTTTKMMEGPKAGKEVYRLGGTGKNEMGHKKPEPDDRPRAAPMSKQHVKVKHQAREKRLMGVKI